MLRSLRPSFPQILLFLFRFLRVLVWTVYGTLKVTYSLLENVRSPLFIDASMNRHKIFVKIFGCLYYIFESLHGQDNSLPLARILFGPAFPPSKCDCNLKGISDLLYWKQKIRKLERSVWLEPTLLTDDGDKDSEDL